MASTPTRTPMIIPTLALELEEDSSSDPPACEDGQVRWPGHAMGHPSTSAPETLWLAHARHGPVESVGGGQVLEAQGASVEPQLPHDLLHLARIVACSDGSYPHTRTAREFGPKLWQSSATQESQK